MAYHPFRHLGLKIVALALREPAVADRRRRARRRAHPAGAGGVPQHSAAARGRRRSARQRRRPAARVVGAAQPAAARRGRRGGRSAAGAAGLAAVPHPQRRGAGAVTAWRSRRCIPGTLGIELERTARRVVPVVAPSSTAIRRRASWSGRVTAEPATVEIAGPESRVKKLANATTEPVTVDRRPGERPRRGGGRV